MQASPPPPSTNGLSSAPTGNNNDLFRLTSIMKRAAERFPSRQQQTSEIDQYLVMATKTGHDDLTEAADKILVKSMIQNLRRELSYEIEETNWMFDN